MMGGVGGHGAVSIWVKNWRDVSEASTLLCFSAARNLLYRFWLAKEQGGRGMRRGEAEAIRSHLVLENSNGSRLNSEALC